MEDPDNAYIEDPEMMQQPCSCDGPPTMPVKEKDGSNKVNN